MKGVAALLASIAVAMLSWGVYGPVLQEGRIGMQGSSLKPFICVGLAYFLIAVLAPAAVLRDERRSWALVDHRNHLEPGGRRRAWVRWASFWRWRFAATRSTSCRSVFGCAPVVNTFLTMYRAARYRQVGPIFIAGLMLVVLGAVTSFSRGRTDRWPSR